MNDKGIDVISSKIDDEKYMKDVLIFMKELCNKKMVDEEEIFRRIKPRPEMKLYYVNDKYFFTETGLETYCEKNNIPITNTNVMEYYRQFAGQSDVLKINGNFYVQMQETVVAVYNTDINGMSFWEYRPGNLNFEYQILKDVGIVLGNDIDTENENVLKKAIKK